MIHQQIEDKMAPTVQKIAKEIVSREGGYVNDPDDPGGATKYGVTIHTMRHLGLDLNRDGRVTSADVKKLTMDDAVDIFIKHYFDKPKISLLPVCLHASVFDMQVNAGGNAIKILQRLLREFGESVSVDGALGPMTAAAAHRAYEKAGLYLYNAYGIARRDYYFALADRRPQSRKYARTRAGGKGGWIRRAEEFMDTKYQMSSQDFQKRVAKW